MNNQQAINLLKDLEQNLDDYCELNDEGKTAFSMAITALELFGNSEQLPSAQPEQRWIPCGERLPEERGFYLTTTKDKAVYCDYWNEDNFDRTEMVIAWMPLPEPYRGGEK